MKTMNKLTTTYVPLIMLHENQATILSILTQPCGDWGLNCRTGIAQKNCQLFYLNCLAGEWVGLWSNDQGSDRVAHSSLTCQFHPVAMWCKWKWKHPHASQCHDNHMTSVLHWHSLIITWFALGGISEGRVKTFLIGWLGDGDLKECVRVSVPHDLTW